jgi:hypothetical protein
MDEQDRSGFVGYLGRRSKKGHQSRINQRYLFLRRKFGLSHEEARWMAEELEKWWPDASQTG